MGETIDVKKVNGTWIVTGWIWTVSISNESIKFIRYEI